MDAQTRRERRQAKIKAGGTDRLSKITKTTNPEAEDYKEPIEKKPVEPAGEQQVFNNENQDDDDPPDVTPEQSSFGQSTPQNYMQDVTPNPQDSQNPQNSQEQDPLMAMLQQLQQQAGGGNGSDDMPQMPNDPLADPIQAFNSIFSQGSQQQELQEPKEINSNELFWKLAHVLSVMLVTLHSMLFNEQSLIYRFCILELILHSARFLLERGSPPADSTLVTIAQYVPEKFKGYIIFAARYMRFASLGIQDVSLCLFFVGIASILS